MVFLWKWDDGDLQGLDGRREKKHVHGRSEGRATTRRFGLLSVCRTRVKANAKNRRKVDCNSLRPEEQATARRLGFLSNGQAKEHTGGKKGGRRCLLTRPGQRAFILESKAR